jgi:outer membrane immunogenic protein
LVAPGLAGAQAPASWSGFYVGADAGASSAHVRARSVDPVAQVTNINPAGPQPLTVVPGTSVTVNQSASDTNLLYGGLVGFNAQSGAFVFGLEADLHGPRNASDTTQSFTTGATILTPPGNVDATRETRTRYDWSLRARLGIGIHRTLLYAAGGIAGTRARLTATDAYTIPAGTSAGGFAVPTIGPNVHTAVGQRTMTGWTAGGGGEQRLGGPFSVGLDLRYSDYGNKNVAFTSATTTRNGATSYPGAEGAGLLTPPDNLTLAQPGATRLSLNEWRLAARLVFRF